MFFLFLLCIKRMNSEYFIKNGGLGQELNILEVGSSRWLSPASRWQPVMWFAFWCIQRVNNNKKTLRYKSSISVFTVKEPILQQDHQSASLLEIGLYSQEGHTELLEGKVGFTEENFNNADDLKEREFTSQ